LGVKITSKSLYTLHFLVALAIRSKDNPARPTHLREIATEFNIPFKFLEQIAILMKSVGLVRGARGKAGGYQLVDLPEQITLSRILKATEGDPFPIADIEGGTEAVQGLLRNIFMDCREEVDRQLLGITLQQLAERAKNQLEPAPMYYL